DREHSLLRPRGARWRWLVDTHTNHPWILCAVLSSVIYEYDRYRPRTLQTVIKHCGEDIDSDRRFDDGDLHAQYLERLGSVRWQRGILTHLHRRDDSCFHYHARRHRLRTAT